MSYVSPNYYNVYGSMVAILVKERIDKGWGPPSLSDMEIIVHKAKAIATIESMAWHNLECKSKDVSL